MPSEPPSTIVCVDCGETAHLLTVNGTEGERIAVYRCSGCADRWDVVVEAEEENDDAGDTWDPMGETGGPAVGRIGPRPPAPEGESDPEP